MTHLSVTVHAGHYEKLANHNSYPGLESCVRMAMWVSAWRYECVHVPFEIWGIVRRGKLRAGLTKMNTEKLFLYLQPYTGWFKRKGRYLDLYTHTAIHRVIQKEMALYRFVLTTTYRFTQEEVAISRSVHTQSHTQGDSREKDIISICTIHTYSHTQSYLGG
jgi:hypothetical protein